MKTEAAVVWNLNDDWKIQEVDLTEPRAGEVRIKMVATGICHTDDHVRTGDLEQPLPAIGGHEGAGIVEAVGPQVPGLQVGDHVVPIYIASCGVCESCARGQANLCDQGANRRGGKAVSDDTFLFSQGHQGITTVCQLGTFSRHIVAHYSQILKIENDIPLDLAALVGCGVTAGFGAAVNTAEIVAGDVVAVVGVGGLGAAAIQGARIAGARIIVAVDPVAGKREAAPRFGATHTAASFDEAESLIREVSWGRMANAAVLTTDLGRGDYVGPTLKLLGKNGRMALVSVPEAGQTTANISLADLLFYEKRLQGALYGHASPRAAIPRVLNLYRSGQLDLEAMVTRRYTLSEINDGFADMKSAKNIRGLVVYDD